MVTGCSHDSMNRVDELLHADVVNAGAAREVLNAFDPGLIPVRYRPGTIRVLQSGRGIDVFRTRARRGPRALSDRSEPRPVTGTADAAWFLRVQVKVFAQVCSMRYRMSSMMVGVIEWITSPVKSPASGVRWMWRSRLNHQSQDPDES